MTHETTTTAAPPEPAALVKVDPTAGFGSVDSFALLQRGGALLAASSLVPQEYRGNMPNCVIALNMAQRIGADPLMVMQNLYVVHGRPGWSAQFLIATFNQNGRFTALRYEWLGERGTDTWGCRAWATEKATGERLSGSAITIALAKQEGWVDRAGSKWKTMPEQMLMYRSAAWFIRAYAPEIAMGLHTTDEIDDAVVDLVPGRNGRYAAPTVVTPATLLSGVTTGQNMQSPGEPAPAEAPTDDPQPGLIARIVAELGRLDPQPDERGWNLICKDLTGTTVLETVDASALDDLLAFVELLVAKDKVAMDRAARITGKK